MKWQNTKKYGKKLYIIPYSTMKLTFCGAAKIVTGSCYYIETGKTKFLVDCGMFQGPKDIMMLNYNPFLFDPKEIDFVLLTHAHIDHCGLIPKLYKGGFKGKIYTTSATQDICGIILEDSAEIQDKNVKQENKRRMRMNQEPRIPLYTIDDVRAAMKLFNPVEYRKIYPITEGIEARFQDAGHIMGSASIEVFITEDGTKKKLVFSGDIGQRDTPIVQDPTLIAEADYLFMESTYGDKSHEDTAGKKELLIKYVNETYKKGGKLLIPSFSVERTQELLYFFNIIIKEGNFPNEKIFLDSPLSIKATEIFKKHTEDFDDEALHKYPHPFDFPELECTESIEDSIKLNTYNDPCIIIAGNGMCTAGRITQHLKHGLWNKKNTLLFVGYQAEGTLGRHILEGEKRVQMMGMEVAVNAEIVKINGFSGHADAEQLMRRAKGFTKAPKKTFIIHGEGNAQVAMKTNLEAIGFTCEIPTIKEEIEL
ncbi:MAG: MBL fold metallo-hydrolase [candidate division SR1 bacterium]|nr:MBL fold metallo-hydrolase [candidate division SR1 bacterium]